MGLSKEKRRQIIAQALSSEVTVVAPSRLLTLLGQSLKFQEQQGMLPPDSAYDLFRGTVPVVQAETDDVPSKCYNTIKVIGSGAVLCCLGGGLESNTTRPSSSQRSNMPNA